MFLLVLLSGEFFLKHKWMLNFVKLDFRVGLLNQIIKRLFSPLNLVFFLSTIGRKVAV